jgi:hypothetical protein
MAFNPNDTARVVGRPDPEPATPPVTPEEDERRRAKMKDRLTEIVGRLEKLAEEQVTKKVQIEDRWYEDLRQYYGRYDATTEAKLANPQNRKSRLFANLTKPKTHAWQARLSDMLFPTDDKNWGIKPTAVPELAVTAERPTDDADAEKARAVMDEAKTHCAAMDKELEDQLRECRYNIHARDVIDDAAKIGTGIMKGPIVAGKARRGWAAVTDITTRAVNYMMREHADPRPRFVRTDPWNYFPDMSARTPDEKEFEFERHLKNKKELRRLAREPGFDQDAIRELLRDGPKELLPNYVNRLREIMNQAQGSLENRYQVWEYQGPLEAEDIEVICTCRNDEQFLEDFEVDPLTELNVIVWFCQGRILKFGPHPLESGDSLYSLFPFEKDDTSLFGLGVPYIMRNSQAAVNAAWRMMMDNAGLSVGPQVVIDKNQVTPENGNYDLTPLKMWLKTGGQTPRQNPPFEIFNIPNNQVELLNIINLARQFIDEETQVPLLAQGEAGARAARPQGSDTMGGMAMLMNSVNVVFRRVVKNFDDDMTTPNIRRLYDWNMQFSQKNSIKGDYEVDARGSSVLLVREVQSQNLLLMAQAFTVHPVLGMWTKVKDLYRKLCQSMMISPDDIVMSEAEYNQAQKDKAENTPPDPNLQLEVEKLNLSKEITTIEMSGKIEIARLDQETQMMKIAEQHNMTVDELASKLQIAREQFASKERTIAAEAALTVRKGPTGGGYF